MHELDHVYYFPIDGEGNEISDPIAVGLNADGSADLSKLPEDLRETFVAFGAPDEVHVGRVYPQEGSRFLVALLNMTSGYLRFRETPDKAPTL